MRACLNSLDLGDWKLPVCGQSLLPSLPHHLVHVTAAWLGQGVRGTTGMSAHISWLYGLPVLWLGTAGLCSPSMELWWPLGILQAFPVLSGSTTLWYSFLSLNFFCSFSKLVQDYRCKCVSFKPYRRHFLHFSAPLPSLEWPHHYHLKDFAPLSDISVSPISSHLACPCFISVSC